MRVRKFKIGLLENIRDTVVGLANKTIYPRGGFFLAVLTVFDVSLGSTGLVEITYLQGDIPLDRRPVYFEVILRGNDNANAVVASTALVSYDMAAIALATSTSMPS